MKGIKLFGAAAVLVATALIGGTMISSALATSGLDADADTTRTAESDSDTDGGEYCQTYLDALASELGITTDELTTAAVAALQATLDAAVANGDLTEEQASEIADRLADGDGSGCAAIGMRFSIGHSIRGGGPGAIVEIDLLETAATAIGLTGDELRERLAGGETLEEVAEAEGVDYATVTAAISDAVEADLDEAVANGDLTQVEADALLERLNEQLAEGTLGGLRFGGGWFAPGGRGPGRDGTPPEPDAES
jgi:polyhydroxyalkanoate synthesis regulator phasin